MVKKFKQLQKREKIFVVLVIILFIVAFLNLAQSRGWFIPAQPGLKISDGVVKLNSMTLEQKIAQMLIVQGDVEQMQAWKNMQLGGVHLFGRKSASVFRNTIIDFQYEMPIPFFVSVDLEGCVNPFGYFINFTPASDVDSLGGAFEKGFREGEFLRDLGINLNFAPVVDLEDTIWKCRSFPGNESMIAEFAQGYVLGLQSQNIIATVKHYPGKTLVVRDPHKFIVTANIGSNDLFPYAYLFDQGDVKAVMVSHIIVSGEVDSEGIPSVVSEKVLGEIRDNFNGLIISDEINMLGLKNFYQTVDEMYIAVFKAGNDVILNFDNNPHEIYRMIQVVKAAVERGDISEQQIDTSVSRVLRAKGFAVR